MKISRDAGPYRFDEVLKDQKRMYLFEDNPQRTGLAYPTYKISEDSWYKLKFGSKYWLYREPEKYEKTSCIRGLQNAYPLCTVGNSKGKFWSDCDLARFSELLEDDICEILQAAPRFNEVVLPWQGFFKTEESGITESRCPKIYRYLKERMDYLWWLLKMV